MVKITPNALQQAEFVTTSWQASVPAGTSMEELTSPKSYELVASSLSAGDHIRLLAEDMSFEAALTVTFKSGSAVRVALRSFTDLREAQGAKEVLPREAYKAKHEGFGKWSIVDVNAPNDAAGTLDKGLTKAEADAKLKKLTGEGILKSEAA